MSPLAVIITILISYIVVGFICTRVALPYYVRSASKRPGEVYYDENEHWTQAKRKTLIASQVRRDTYFMTFLWPAYLPITLAHGMAGRAITNNDPDEPLRLRQQADNLELKGITSARRDEDDDRYPD